MPEIKSDIGLIAQTIKAGLDLWKTFIATRQEAYTRQMDKKKSQAIDAAEKYILEDMKLKGNLSVKEIAAIDRVKASWQRRFFRLNN